MKIFLVFSFFIIGFSVFVIGLDGNFSQEENYSGGNKSDVINFSDEVINGSVIGNFSDERASFEVNESNLSEDVEVGEVVFEPYVKRTRIIIGRPVKWIRRVDMGEGSVSLPEGVENVSILTGGRVGEAFDEIEDYDGIVEVVDRESLVGGGITGLVSLDVYEGKGWLVRFRRWVSGFTISGRIISSNEISGNIIEMENETIVDFGEVIEDGDVAVEYYTEAPEISEQVFSEGKRFVISASDELMYKDILAYTELDGVKKSLIQFYHVVDGVREVASYDSYDFDGDGLVDYIEWIVPYLSNQTYELIIEITKAEHLDENRTFVDDVYDEVFRLDDVWSGVIGDGEYVRVTFEKELDKQRDVTIYPRVISGDPRIEVSEVGESEIVAEFSSIISDEYNKVYLSGLEGVQDVFDLKIVGGSLEFDHIIDPLDSVMIGTWTDGSGTFDATPTVNVWTGVPFDSEIAAHVEYTQDVNNIDVDLASGGKYLVLYNLRITSDYNDRLGWETKLTLDDVDVAGSFASCYQRSTSNDNAVCGAGAVIDASAGDDVRVELNYRTSNGDQVATMVAGDASLQIVKLDDDWDYARYAKTADQVISSYVGGPNWVDLTWETELEEGSGFIHPYDSDDSKFQLVDGGHYLLITGASASDTTRVTFETKTLVNDVEIPYARSYSYNRGSDDHQEGNPWFVGILDVSAGDYLQVQMGITEIESAQSGNTIEGSMGLQLVKLPDSANYYRAYATTARDPTASVETPTKFNMIDVEDEEDAAFDGDVSTGDIAIQSGYEGDYLFLFSGTGTRTSTSGTRSIPYLEWYRDGSSMNLGGLGWFVRGAQGSVDCFRGGSSGGVIVDGSGTSTFNLYGYTLGQDPNQDRLDASEYGVMAVRLDDFVSVSSDESYPQFSDYWDDNASLEGSGTASFNVSVTSTNGTVLLEVNGTNYTASNLMGDVYNVSVFLVAGSYVYRWHSWGDGVDENYNVSVDRDYVVNASSLSISISLSSALSGEIAWSILTLPLFNQSAPGNKGEGVTDYYVNVSSSPGNVDLYVRASDDLKTSGLDVLGIGNESYSFSSVDSSVSGGNKFSLTTDFSDNKIGDNLADGSVVYLKFFLDAPSGQAPGVYNNSLLFNAVEYGVAP